MCSNSGDDVRRGGQVVNPRRAPFSTPIPVRALLFTLIPQRMLCCVRVFFFQFMLVGPLSKIVHKLEGGTPFMEKAVVNRKDREFWRISQTFGG